MQRSIMPMGKRSCVVTLPSTWLQEQNLYAGAEVEIVQEGNILLVSAKKGKKLRNFQAEIQGLESMLNRYIGALYKAGYDDIILSIEKKQLKTIENVLKRTLVGFEILEITKNQVHIQKIAELDSIDVDTLIKQIFFTLQVIGEELVDALRTRDFAKISEITGKDDQVNRLADSARRYLNKRQGDCLSYAFVEQLENIGDSYNRLAKAALEKKKIPLKGLESLNALLKNIYHLYYAFTLKELELFGKAGEDAKKITQEPKELYLLYTQIFDIHGIALTKNIGGKKEDI